jgi:guanylate kinase
VADSQRRQGLLFLLVGPPGVGKNTLMKTVLARPVGRLRQLPTATTRPIRPNEQQGREHLFVTHDEFRRMIANNELIEWQNVHKDDLYGMPRATVENAIINEDDLIADIDVLGATYLRSVYPDNVILIFIAPLSNEDLIERMRKRGETETTIATRMQRVEMEMPYAPLCDYLIVNDEETAAAEALRGIILAENSRRALMNLRVENELPRQRMAFSASVIPYCGSEVLYSPIHPHFPTAILVQGELPHDAALRALSNTLKTISPTIEYLSNYTPGSSTFVPPLTVNGHMCDHFIEITFIYEYALQERVEAPNGWQWIPRDDMPTKRIK